MIKILKEVILQRQLKCYDDYTITLSPIFMQFALEDLRKETGLNIKTTPMETEFKLIHLNKEYRVINRTYKDNDYVFLVEFKR